VVKSLFVGEDCIANNPSAFELFGYDVMLDADLRPWLIEINASPSMEMVRRRVSAGRVSRREGWCAQETELDRDVKPQLIADTIQLVGPPDYDRTVLESVLQRRISGTPKHVQNNSPTRAHLAGRDGLEDIRVLTRRCRNERRHQRRAAWVRTKALRRAASAGSLHADCAIASVRDPVCRPSASHGRRTSSRTAAVTCRETE
jgi:hypothetical protein